MNGYRGLGFDPTPGSVDAVAAAAGEYAAAAAALAGVEPALRRVGESAAAWDGAAAEGFRARLSAVPADLDQRVGALQRAAGALAEWAQTLAANKRAGNELDAAAAALRRRVDAAQDDVHGTRNALDLAATPATAARAGVDHATAEAALADLEARLADLLRQGRALRADHDRAADAAADALRLDAPAATSAVPRALGTLLDRVSTAAAALAGLFVPAQSTGPHDTAPEGYRLPGVHDRAPAAPGGAAAFAAGLATAPSGEHGTGGELITFGGTAPAGPDRR